MSKLRSFLALVAAFATFFFTAAPTGPIFSNPPRSSGTVASAQQAKAPYVLAKGGIPLIGVATGTMANNGAMTIGTALPLIYPDAYFYMPAGSVAAGVPAAATWLYGTCTTATACTVFNNSYTSGVPTIPASPVAFSTTGPGAFTGDTGEEFGNTITVPANSMGPNGQIRIALGYFVPNNADTKTARIRLSGNSGTIFAAPALANFPGAKLFATIANTGATGKQIAEWVGAPYSAGGGMISSGVAVLGTIDTTASMTLVFSIQRGTATDNIIQLPPTVELISDGT